MKALLLPSLLAFLWVNFGRTSAEVRCKLPASAWCSSLEAARQCGVLKRCLKANLTKRLTAEPVKIGVFYETLCPDCRGFFTEMLLPSALLLGDVMNLTVVPYGNAQETFDGQKYVFTCQHGELECLGNMIQACVLNLTQTSALSVIFCMESAAAANVTEAARMCVELYAPDLNWKALMTCVGGDLGNQIMHQNALRTKALSPPHTFVPWITVNGVHTDALQDKATSSLVSLVCSLYKGVKPDACG